MTDHLRICFGRVQPTGNPVPPYKNEEQRDKSNIKIELSKQPRRPEHENLPYQKRTVHQVKLPLLLERDERRETAINTAMK